MILGLIGMSGVGKTVWSHKFAAAGYECLHCDDLIADKLRAEGAVVDGSVYDLGRWMGFPFDARYKEREAHYLAYEAEVLGDIAASLEHSRVQDRRLVIDMTGSAIYVAPAILSALRRRATIVYLAAAPAQYDQLLQAYRATPRPVIWNGLFLPQPHEDHEIALVRCYGDLLRSRAALYESLSDITLDPALHQDDGATVADFLRYVDLQRHQS